MSGNNAINVRALIDSRPLGKWQKMVVLLGFCIIALDGFDIVIMGFIAPELKADWQITNRELGLVISAALIGLSLNTAAYTSETLRAAISSIDKGQWEAAASIGMTRWQTLRRVILPQAARTALPPLGNSFIGLVKDTSLAATIQVPELFRQAQLITSRTLEVFTMYLAASLIYWVMATLLSALQNRLEAHVNRQDQE